MVKSKAFQAEYVQEFIDERKKVAATRKRNIDELEQMIAKLTPKFKEEYARGFRRAFRDFDGKMKLHDFLNLTTLKEEPAIAEGTQITINSKPPRMPRNEEILFSVDGTPIRI